MLDISFIRDNLDLVKKSSQLKGVSVDFEKLLSLDENRRELIQKAEGLRSEQKKISGKSGSDISEAKKLKVEVQKASEKLDKALVEYEALMLQIPNIILGDVPEGKDESENKIIREWGDKPKFEFEPKDHVQLGKDLDIIDIERAVKVSGSRFTYIKGEAAMLQMAIVQFVFQTLSSEEKLKEIAAANNIEINTKTFRAVVPPVIIKEETMRRMARLSDEDKDERYHLPQDDQYLVGSAEHSIGPMHMDEILDEDDLPLRYIGYSTSFRREAGSYGKDTKGIIRLHQFDKLEMETFSTPETSTQEQDFIVAIQEYLVQQLNIPYQVIMICTGDIGKPDARQVDINCWMPGEGAYRETHTSDLMTDYQSRRLNTRMKRKDGSKEFVHMNDATAFAIGRILVALLENNQQKDGSISIPEVLQPLCGFSSISPRSKS